MRPTFLNSLFLALIFSIFAFGVFYTSVRAEEYIIDLVDTDSQRPASNVILGDIDGDGDLDLIAGNAGQDQKMVYRNDGTGSFPLAQGTQLPEVAEAMTTTATLGDLNNDGALDLVLGHYPNSKTNSQIQIYHNVKGTGVFTHSLSFGQTSSKVVSIALGDVTGDGALDIVVGNECGQNQIYRNNKTGGIDTTPIEFDNIQCDGASKVSSIVLGDVDGDSLVDIVVGINGGPNRIFFNNYVNEDSVSGDFSTSPLYFGDVYSRTTSIALGDLDNDGLLDIVASNTPTVTQDTQVVSGPNEMYRISRERNQRNQNTFFKQSPIRFGVYYNGNKLQYIDNATSIALADINGDGQLDILIANTNLEVQNHNGGPSSINKRNRIYTYYPSDPIDFFNGERATWSVAVGDIDGNGTLDIIAGNTAGNTGGTSIAAKFTCTCKKDQADRRIFPENSFHNLLTTITNTIIVLGDLNNDTYLDIIGSSENVSYFSLNNKANPGNFPMVSSLNITGVKSVALGNLDGTNIESNASLDLVVAKEGKPNQIQIYQNKGEPNFFDSPCLTCILTLGVITPTTIVLGDLDGNSFLDLVVGYDGYLNQVYFNDGNLNFSRTITLTQIETNTINHTKSLALGDMNGDGALDIVAGNNDKDLVYLNKNDGYGAFSEPIVLDANTNLNTFSIAVGDIDGNGSLDIIDGNQGQQGNYVYYNNGKGTAYSDKSLPDLNGTCAMALGDLNNDETIDMVCGADLAYLSAKNGVISVIPLSDREESYQDRSVALGDLNSDGLLDMVAGGTPTLVPTIVFNIMRNKIGLTNNPPGMHIRRPGYTPDANFYSTSEILSNQLITIPYTLFDAESDKVGHVIGQYSLNGGGNWFTANPTTITTTLALTTSKYLTMPIQHAYTWNTQDIFGQPQNVVFRLKAIPQAAPGLTERGSYHYTNTVAGPFQWPYVAATTFPFRIGGTQVQVVDCMSSLPPCKGVANAVVYRKQVDQLLAQPFSLQTNPQGFIGGQSSVGPGDQLMALWPIASTNYVTFTNKYTLYYTSGNFQQVSAADTQVLTISAKNKLLLFNLNVSLEWDAHNDTLYQAQLQKDLRHVSEFLYDWTNGQVALGQINLYFDRQNWENADIRIYANNRFHPNADQGGVITNKLTVSDTMHQTQEAYTRGEVRIGAIWNRYGDDNGSVGEDWARALAHELGHYLLFLDDNYFGFDQAGHFTAVRSCRGAMFDPYHESESEFYPNKPSEWENDCKNTFSNYATRRSDWATIDKFYPDLVIPEVTYSQIISGPGLSLDVTHITPQHLDNATEVIATPIFNLVKGGKTFVTSLKTRAILFQADQLIDLGRPVNGEVVALGAHKGDRLCIFELEAKEVVSPRYWKCQSIEDRGLVELEEVSEKWPPEILIHPKLMKDSQNEKMDVTIEVREIISGTLNRIELSARLYPDTLSASSELPLTGNDGVYTVSFSFTKTVTSAYVHLIGVDKSFTPPRTYEIVTNYSLGGSPGFSISTGKRGAPAISTDGHALLYLANAEPLEENDFFSLQPTTVNRNTPAWFTPVGHAYRLIASRRELLIPTMGDVASTTITGTMILNYLGDEAPAGQEKWLVMYYKDDEKIDAQWEPIRGSTVISDRNYVAAPLQGPGFYALMATIETPELKSGWEEFSYPDTDPRPVSKALASIKKAYTSVYWRNGDRWLLYDRLVRPEFFGLVNYNDTATKLLEMKPFESYWIYVLNDTIPYIGIPSGQESRINNITPLPPATFYGWVEATDIYTPTVGDPIIARIDNQIICGVGEVLLYDPTRHAVIGSDRDFPEILLSNQTYLPVVSNFRIEAPRYAYKMQIRSDTGDGCGVFGRDIAFEIAGKTLPSNYPWGNSQACYHSLGKPTQKPYQCFTFATPDLIVSQLNITSNSVEVVIKNAGSAPVPPGTGFWVDVYINPTRQPMQVNETWQVIAVENGIPLEKAQGLTWSVRDLALPLEPGQTMTFTIGDANYRPVYSNFSGIISPGDRIYAHVDSANDKTDYGGVLEGHEMLLQTYNNIRSYPVEMYLPLIVKND